MKYPADVSAERTERIRDLLIETVENEPLAKRKRRWRRIRISLPFVIVGIGAATVAGSSILQSESVDDYSIVHCFQSAERGQNGEYAEAQAVLEQERIEGASIDDAIGICREMWSQGALPLGGDALDPTPGLGEPPALLTPCVMPNGDAAVVPGEAEVCAVVGLAPFG